jgi:hypothetical protein
MSTLIAEFRPSLRLLIGDDSPSGDYEYTDAQLDAAVGATFQMGTGPEGYALAAGVVEPTVSAGDPFAQVLVQSALLRLGGEATDYTLKTRGFYFSTRGGNRARLLNDLSDMLRDARGDACAFASRQELDVWLASWRGQSVLSAETVVKGSDGYELPVV